MTNSRSCPRESDADLERAEQEAVEFFRLRALAQEQAEQTRGYQQLFLFPCSETVGLPAKATHSR